MPWSVPPSGAAREPSGPGGALSYLLPVVRAPRGRKTVEPARLRPLAFRDCLRSFWCSVCAKLYTFVSYTYMRVSWPLAFKPLRRLLSDDSRTPMRRISPCYGRTADGRPRCVYLFRALFTAPLTHNPRPTTRTRLNPRHWLRTCAEASRMRSGAHSSRRGAEARDSRDSRGLARGGGSRRPRIRARARPAAAPWAAAARARLRRLLHRPQPASRPPRPELDACRPEHAVNLLPTHLFFLLT